MKFEVEETVVEAIGEHLTDRAAVVCNFCCRMMEVELKNKKEQEGILRIFTDASTIKDCDGNNHTSAAWVSEQN